MIERTITTAGCVTYWTLPAYADLAAVTHAFAASGYSTLAPQAPSEFVALRDSLAALYGRNDVLIRPLKGGGGYNVVHERRNGDKNHYSWQLTATLSPFHVDPEDQAERVLCEMENQRARASRTALAKCLTDAIPLLGGITLRDSGGIYYLPPHAETAWERIAYALESAAAGTCIYRLRTAHGKEELRAIRDAAIADLTAEAERIREECAAGMSTMRETTAVHRRMQIADLRDRLTVYRDLLGEGLQTIVDAIDQADVTAGAVQLAATARLSHERKATR